CTVPEGVRRLFFREKPEEDGGGRFRMEKTRLAVRLNGMSEAFSTLAAPPGETGGGERFSLFGRACETVCAGCIKRSICWNGGEGRRQALIAAADRIFARGRAEPEDLAEALDCRSPEAFCAAVTETLRDRRREQLRLTEREEEERRLERQFKSLSDILDLSAEENGAEDREDKLAEARVRRIAAEMGADCEAVVRRDARGALRVELCAADLSVLFRQPDEFRRRAEDALETSFEPPTQTEGRLYASLSLREQARFVCRVGACAERRRGERVSGDCGTYFRADDGVTYVILCDGTGSGERAHGCAETAMRLTENFLRAGVSPASAVEIVAASLERRDGGAVNATLDVTGIDPYSSVLTSVKYGAAPAYIRHRTADGQYSLSRISAGGGGGELYAVAEASARLSDGDMVLIVSDGAECGPALEKAILGVMTDDPRDLCEILMRLLPGEARDDRTVIAVSYCATDARERRPAHRPRQTAAV
ncbi:MAG: SpoIIE family protein phosphatase, partial [Oscillospiraceae bacterium]|nr:SpoIIE family protein phosphatase [Oscillospiraceae bacterium]